METEGSPKKAMLELKSKQFVGGLQAVSIIIIPILQMGKNAVRRTGMTIRRPKF